VCVCTLGITLLLLSDGDSTLFLSPGVYICVDGCAGGLVCAFVMACVRVCARVCVCVYVYTQQRFYTLSGEKGKRLRSNLYGKESKLFYFHVLCAHVFM